MTTLAVWRCIPCGATSNVGTHCFLCGRRREDATDADRWGKFFALDAEIADEEPCRHDHVEHDDDGLARRWSVCTDCGEEVVPSEPDEDGRVYWETI
jgi:hypothetical protein